MADNRNTLQSNRLEPGDDGRPDASMDDRFDALRRRAERLLDANPEADEAASMQDDVVTLVEELRVYQVELELQNEELRNARQQVEAAGKRYRELFEHAPIGYVLFDRDGVVKAINRTGESLLDLPPDRAVGKPFLLYLQSDYRDLFAHHLRLTLSLDAEQTCELIVRRPDESTFWARLQSRPFIAPDGERRVRTALLNISAQKRLEQELIAAREEALRSTQVQRAFLSSMSHEIRTPLTSVIGFADVLDELATDDQQREIALLIKGSGRRLLSTLNSVLSYARLQERDTQVTLQPLNVPAVAHDSVRLLQPLAETQQVHLRFESDLTATYARLHEDHFERVLDNLVSNALKYTEEGSVTVRVRDDDGTVAIEVEDTGVGIDPSMQSMIFEPFFQAGSGLARTRDGIGLGLSITRQLVESMDGEIAVVSERNEGTRFTVTFPKIDLETAAREAISEDPFETPAVSAASILLVDDREETHRLVDLFLRDAADVTAVCTAAEAMQHVEASRFDVILLDIQLDGPETGMELLHRMRSRENGHAVPIVAFTAYALPGDRDRFQRAGFNGYLDKPFTKHELLRTLERVMNDDGGDA